MSDRKVEDCWNTVGSWGWQKPRCSELEIFGHCFNCKVYSGVGRRLLDRQAPEGYLDEWERVLNTVKQDSDGEITSLVIFSVSGRYFSFSTRIMEKVTEFHPVHSLPHSRHEALLGITNILGELMVSVSLLVLLNFESHKSSNAGASKRNVIVKLANGMWSLPVDEVLGIHKLNLDEHRISKTSPVTRCISLSFMWENREVYFIDEKEFSQVLEAIRF